MQRFIVIVSVVILVISGILVDGHSANASIADIQSSERSAFNQLWTTSAISIPISPILQLLRFLRTFGPRIIGPVVKQVKKINLGSLIKLLRQLPGHLPITGTPDAPTSTPPPPSAEPLSAVDQPGFMESVNNWVKNRSPQVRYMLDFLDNILDLREAFQWVGEWQQWLFGSPTVSEESPLVSENISDAIEAPPLFGELLTQGDLQDSPLDTWELGGAGKEDCCLISAAAIEFLAQCGKEALAPKDLLTDGVMGDRSWRNQVAYYSGYELFWEEVIATSEGAWVKDAFGNLLRAFQICESIQIATGAGATLEFRPVDASDIQDLGEQVYVFQKVCSRNPLSRTDVCVGGRWSRVYDVHEYIFLIRRSNVLVAVYYKTFGRKVWVPNEGYAPIRSLLRLAVEKAANPVRAENIGMPVPIE